MRVGNWDGVAAGDALGIILERVSSQVRGDEGGRVVGRVFYILWKLVSGLIEGERGEHKRTR